MRLRLVLATVVALAGGLVLATSSGAAPFASDLVMEWNGAGSGTTVLDGSGSGNDATLVNGAQFGTGRFGPGFVLDGVDDRVVADSYNGIGGGAARTVDLWFRTTSTAIRQALLYYGAETTAQRFYLSLENGNQVGIRIYGARVVYAAPALADNAWHHVALTMASGARVDEVQIYVDGALLSSVVDSVAPATVVNTGSSYPVRAGVRANGADPFQGNLDEIRLYDRAMSAAEIQTLYTWSPLSVPEPGTAAAVVVSLLVAGTATLRRGF